MPGSPEHEAQAELPSQSSVVDCRNRTHASWLVLHSCRVRFAQATVLVSNDTMVLCLGLRRKQLNRPSRLLKIACLLLLVCIISCSSSQGFAGVPSGKRKSCGHKGISRGASRWWTAFNTCDCSATRIQHAFETQMQTEDVPVLQSWDAYQSSLPVREGTYGVNKLYLRPFSCCERDLDVAVSHLEQGTEDRNRVAYLSAPTKRGKSAAILPMFCRSVELGSENSFTHYLYMPFANNDGNCNSP